MITIDDLEEGKDHEGRVWFGERCKSDHCRGKRVTIGYAVDDEVWAKVVKGRVNILCFSCFDEMAQDQGVDYEARIFDGVVFFCRSGNELRWVKRETETP